MLARIARESGWCGASAQGQKGKDQAQHHDQSAERTPHQPHFRPRRVRPGGEEVGFQVAFGEFLPCWVTSRSSLVRAASAFSPAIVFASSTAA